MSLKKNAVEEVPLSDGLTQLLQNLIKDNPAQAMELLAKLQVTQGNETPVGHHKPSEDDPFLNIEYRGFGKKGVKPKAVKINIFAVPGEGNWVSLQLGEKPKIHVLRGVDWIIPEDYLPLLTDSVVHTFEHVPLQQPDSVTGNVFREIQVTKVRFPFQNLGEATWEEYEEFRAKLAQDGISKK